MSVGIIVPLPAYTLNPAFIASKAEALGFESIWYHEHPILPVDSASPFPATGAEIPSSSAGRFTAHLAKNSELLNGIALAAQSLVSASQLIVRLTVIGR